MELLQSCTKPSNSTSSNVSLCSAIQMHTVSPWVHNKSTWNVHPVNLCEMKACRNEYWILTGLSFTNHLCIMNHISGGQLPTTQQTSIFKLQQVLLLIWDWSINVYSLVFYSRVNYSIINHGKQCRTQIIFWTHKTHKISCLHGWAMGFLLWLFCQQCDYYPTTQSSNKISATL